MSAHIGGIGDEFDLSLSGDGATAPLPAGLYIIATPIGNLGDMTLRAIDTLRRVDIIACEDTREAGKLTSVYGIKTTRTPYHDHNAARERPRLIKMIQDGQAVGLISDAGTPLVSDPGYKFVEAAVAAGVMVTTVPGASACLSALQLSALPSDRFMFAGFLPPKSGARRKELTALKNVPATLIFYETAPRLADSLRDMAEVLGDRPAAVVREITKKFEEARRATLTQLAAHYEQAGQPKGEIVIVIGAAADGDDGAWDDAAVATAVAQALDVRGLSVKDAAAEIAAASERKKSEVYQIALDHKQSQSDD